MSSIAGYSGGIAPKNAEGNYSAEFARMATDNLKVDLAGWNSFAEANATWDVAYH